MIYQPSASRSSIGKEQCRGTIHDIECFTQI